MRYRMKKNIENEPLQLFISEIIFEWEKSSEKKMRVNSQLNCVCECKIFCHYRSVYNVSRRRRRRRHSIFSYARSLILEWAYKELLYS